MEHQKGRVMVGELADAIPGYAAGEPLAREIVVKTLKALAMNEAVKRQQQ